jgi:transcriptional regulator
VLLLEELSTCLTREEQVFLDLRYFQGLKIREIAEALDTTEARTSHIGRSAIRKIERAVLDER